MDNRSVNLVTRWQTGLLAASKLNYDCKKEVFKRILEELSEYQNYFERNICDISILGAFVRNMRGFQLQYNIVVAGDEISEAAVKALEYLSKIEI